MSCHTINKKGMKSLGFNLGGDFGSTLLIFYANSLRFFTFFPHGNKSSVKNMLKINQNGDFLFWHFPPIFVKLKVTCLVTLFDCKLQVFNKLTIFGIFNVKCKRSASLAMLNELFL